MDRQRWVLPDSIDVAAVRRALAGRERPWPGTTEVPTVVLPTPAHRPAAVLCALFDDGGQAQVVLTRRSSRLRSHTHQVSFPGGRIEPGEDAVAAALREAYEEVGLPPDTVEIVGQLSELRTVANPAPITPFVGSLACRPLLVPNSAEVERAFTVSLAELLDPDVFWEERWTLADDDERSIYFFELVGDTVWGATARMLVELLDMVAPAAGPAGPAGPAG